MTIARMSCQEITNVGGPPLGRVRECASMLWNKFASKPTAKGSTPLLMEAANGHEAVVGRLIAAGAAIGKATTTSGATPRWSACS